MPQQELLRRVAAVLERLNIPYMVTGSHVSSLQGAPRSTHDIDLVVEISASAALALVQAFPSPDYYLDLGAVQEAIRFRSQFNLLDAAEGDKVDFWLLTEEPFDQSRFSRRVAEDLGDLRVPISQPEDTILQKLKWCIQDGFFSEKQFGDALRVYELQAKNLDLEYIAKWITPLGLADVWARLLREARPI